MLPDKLTPKAWTFEAVKYVRETLKDQIDRQIQNQISNQALRENDLRSEKTIENQTILSIITELSVADWLKGKKNQLDFNPSDPYTYAWDVFALGRRIEVKKFGSRNFNIDPRRRGGGCVDMHTFETFDVSELLFACKVEIDHDILVSPIFLMTRESYFNCRTPSEQNKGTFYLQYDAESRRSPDNCKVY